MTWRWYGDAHAGNTIREHQAIARGLGRLLAENLRLRAQNARLRAAIDAVEWVAYYTGNHLIDICPWCQEEQDGHAPDCQRQEARKEDR